MSIGGNLKQCRKNLKMTLNDVSEQAGIGVSVLSEIENGKRDPKIQQVKILAELYKQPFSVLFEEQLPERDVVMWRERPALKTATEIESEFTLLSTQYHNLEVWNDELKEPCLPETKVKRTLNYPFAKQLAKDFRNQHQLGDYPAFCLKQVLEEICGVKIFHLPVEPTGTAACSISSSFGAAILLNSYNVRWRRNFDLAHELFHILTWNLFPKVPETGPAPEEEKLATCFARHLLMPIDSFRGAVDQIIEDGTIDLWKLLDLSREFDVSIDAIIYHLDFEYNLENAASLIERCRGMEVDKPERHSDNPDVRPERYSALARKALANGEISIGTFAKYMGYSRPQAMRIAEQELISSDEKISITPS